MEEKPEYLNVPENLSPEEKKEFFEKLRAEGKLNPKTVENLVRGPGGTFVDKKELSEEDLGYIDEKFNVKKAA